MLAKTRAIFNNMVPTHFRLWFLKSDHGGLVVSVEYVMHTMRYTITITIRLLF